MFGILLVSTEALAGSIVPKGSVHEDHRGTPRIEFPDASTSQAKSSDEYLQTHAHRFKLPSDLSNLDVVSMRESLAGIHTRYQQFLNGIPVDGAEVVVSQRKKDGSVYQVYNNTYPVDGPVPASKGIINKNAALQAAWNHLQVHGNLKALPKAELLYVPHKKGFRLVYKILIAVDAPQGYWEHRIDALSGGVVSVQRHEISEKHARNDIPDFADYKGPTWSFQAELNRLDEQQAVPETEEAAGTTTVDGTALVFDPDPRTTLANDALLDSSSASTFDPAYFTRTLKGITLDAGVYHLEGPWVTITKIGPESPPTAVSTTTDGNWTAKRGNNAFNDVMCYYHIDQNQRYLQSLGFTNGASVQAVSISVDSDGVGGDDNSWYVPSQNYIAFGHGGVDDNEDADVILHEYGHALTLDIVPSWSEGDSGAIGEGFGDYWGASYSWTQTNGSTHHPEWAFSWDGHGADTWSGRLLSMTNLTYDHSHTYQAHESISGIPNYSDQLWGTPIYQAFRDLIDLGRPRIEMDTIIIESFFGLGSGVKMRDMANATVAAAQTLYPGGPHAGVYYTRFVNQLIIEQVQLPDPVLLYPTGGEVLNGGSTANVQWSLNGAPAEAKTSIQYTSQLSGGTPALFDDVESGVNGWTATKTGGSDWLITTSESHSPTHSWFATDDTSASDQFLTSSSIMVSNGAVLAFWHYYDLESGCDGAVVEISTNGTTWIDIGANATQNGYVATISPGYSSPISGREAFTGSSGGFIETRIPLSGYEGSSVQIRFRESDDSSAAETGWWVDSFEISIAPQWIPIATTQTNATSYSWTLPATTGTNYGIRLKLTGSNYADSAWVESSAFILSYDIDADGLPNWWELLYFGNITNANYLAVSSNGVNTLIEAYVSGLDPTDPNAQFTLSGMGSNLSWNGVSGRVYSVYWTSDLLNGFQPLETNILWSAGGFSDAAHSNDLRAFYKLKVELENP